MKRIEKYKNNFIQVMDQTGLTLKEAIQEINKDIKTDEDILKWLDYEFYEYEITTLEKEALIHMQNLGYAKIYRKNGTITCSMYDSFRREKEDQFPAYKFPSMFSFITSNKLSINKLLKGCIVNNGCC